MRTRSFAPIVLAFLFAGFSLAGYVSASRAEETKPLDLSVAFRYGILVGDEESGVKWSDVYENGLGGSVELAYRVIPLLAIHGGLSYDHYSGKTVAVSVPGIGVGTGEFNDQDPLSLYIGLKSYFLGSTSKTSGADPYVRADIGVSFLNETKFNGSTLGKSSTEFTYALGIGMDVRISSITAFFLEAKFHDYGKPDNAGNSLKAVPLSFGLRFFL